MADDNLRDTAGRDHNEDPISGEPGAHPVGVGLGTAAGGAAAGAAAGAVAGPAGTVIGTVAGGIAGGLAGKAIAEQIDPTAEEAYWREEYQNRDYYDPATGYEEVGPAYRYGWESRAKYEGRNWDEVESDLERGWTEYRGDSSIEWEKARRPTRDAWERIDRDQTLAQERDRQPSKFDRAEADRTEPGVPRTPK